METETRPALPVNSAPRGERIAKIGTILSAILASSCCWLPLVLLAVGISGAGIASTLAEYRWIFMIVTFGFLGMAFYFTYRPRRAAVGATAQAADCCSPQADCCAPQSSVAAAAAGSAAGTAPPPRVNMMAVNKVMLWVVTFLAIAFLFFPKYLTSMFMPGDEFTADMTLTEFKVKGMWCDGCATPVAKAIREAPGVLAVKIDYPTELATVGTAPDQLVPREEILNALKAIGFSGEFEEP